MKKTVEVLSAPGKHAEREPSWGKGCSNSRKWEDGTEGGALAFYGTGASAVTKAFNCATKPETKLEKSALEGYSCACE